MNQRGLCALLIGGWLCWAGMVPAQEQETCRVEIRLDSIVCLSANDNPDETDDAAPRGEYYVRVDNQQELGPFELKTGEGSSFNPGLLLKAIDTGVLKGGTGREMMITVNLVIHVREDDSMHRGEDGADDVSGPIVIRERVVCPGVAIVRRTISLPPNPDFDDNRPPDVVALTLRIAAK